MRTIFLMTLYGAACVVLMPVFLSTEEPRVSRCRDIEQMLLADMAADQYQLNFDQDAFFSNLWPKEMAKSDSWNLLYEKERMLANYIKNEEYNFDEGDKLRKPIRTTYEMKYFSQLKEKIKESWRSGVKLGPIDLLKLALHACRDRQGSTNVYTAMLTAHNVIRALARGNMWWYVSEEKFDPNDPMLPIFNELRTDNLNEKESFIQLFKTRSGARNLNFMSYKNLYNPKNQACAFVTMPRTPEADANSGAHYYYWVGTLAQSFGGMIATHAIIWKEIGVRYSMNRDEGDRVYDQTFSTAEGANLEACLKFFARKAKERVAEYIKQRDQDREKQYLQGKLAEWEKALKCLLEGRRLYPNYWMDCNGNWTLGSRDVAIDQLTAWIAEARSKLQALGVNVAETIAPPGDSSPSTLQRVQNFLVEGWNMNNRIVSQDQVIAPGQPEQPWEEGVAPPPGSRIKLGSQGQLELQSPNGLGIVIKPGSDFELVPPSVTGSYTAIRLRQGQVILRHPSNGGGKSDCEIRSPDGVVRLKHTEVTVTVDETGTRVEVKTGPVEVTGKQILRLGGEGKPAPVKEMLLKDDESAFMPRMAASSTGSSALPGWLQGGETHSAQDSTTPGKDKGLPGWVSGTSGNQDRQPATKPRAQPAAVNPLKTLDPWNQPAVQSLMDEWLRQAIPPCKTPGIRMHYNEWAQPLSQAARSTGIPDHPADWTRFRYLWENRLRYTSTNLCTLARFLELKLSGQSLAECQTPAAATRPAKLAANNQPAQPAPSQPVTQRASLPAKSGDYLARLSDIPAAEWLNGKPDLSNRTVLVFIYPEFLPTTNLYKIAADCLQMAQNRLQELTSRGIVFVVLARYTEILDGDPMEIWGEILKGWRWQFPVAVTRHDQFLNELMRLNPQYQPENAASHFHLFLLNPQGKIIRHDSCNSSFYNDLIPNKKR